MSNKGKISQVMGAVVDVVFEDGHLPDGHRCRRKQKRCRKARQHQLQGRDLLPERATQISSQRAG